MTALTQQFRRLKARALSKLAARRKPKSRQRFVRRDAQLPSVPLPGIILKKVRALRARTRNVAVAIGLARLIRFLGIAILAQMTADYLFTLSWNIRLWLLIFDAAIILWIGAKRLLKPIVRPLSTEAAALRIERQWPILRGRVISAVQLANPGPTTIRASETLFRALLHEAASIVARCDVRAIVSLNPVWRAWKHLAVAACILALIGFLSWPAPKFLLLRVLLVNVPVPHETMVTDLTGITTVVIGDNVTLMARAEGIVPGSGHLAVVGKSGQRQNLTLRPAPGNSKLFKQELRAVTESFSYEINIGDGSTGWQNIAVVPRPSLTEVRFTVKPPAYAGGNTQPRGPSDLAVLPGSEIGVDATVNRDVNGGEIRLAGTSQLFPLSRSDRKLSGSLIVPAQDVTGFSIDLLLPSGGKSTIPTVFAIRLLEDKPPALKIIEPMDLQDVMVAADKLKVRVAAWDDIGVAKVTLRYRATKSTDQEAGSVPFDLSKLRDRKNAACELIADIAAWIPVPKVGMSYEYWVEVEDGNNVTGPGVAKSDKRVLNVVTLEEKRAILMGRMDENLKSLQEVRDAQKKTANELGNVIRARRASGSGVRPAPPRPAPATTPAAP